MSRVQLDQRGASHIVALLAVLLLVVVGFAGYRVMTANKATVADNATAPVAVKQVAAPTKIQSKADVTQAAKALDSDQLDSNLDSAQLNADLNSML
jgi:flagellar basal body-associated protein FliL